MESAPQTHRAYFGLGQLVRDNAPSISVRYDIVVVSRRVDVSTLARPSEVLQECEQGEGIVTLVNNSDVGLIDVSVEYTLECVDGRRCHARLSQDRNLSLTRFLITCSPADSISMN